MLATETGGKNNSKWLLFREKRRKWSPLSNKQAFFHATRNFLQGRLRGSQHATTFLALELIKKKKKKKKRNDIVKHAL